MLTKKKSNQVVSVSNEKAGSLLLDSSIVIEMFRGNREVRQELDKVAVLYLPSIVVGELHRGLYKAQRPEEGRAKIARLQSASVGVNVDARTGEYFAEIDAALAAQGKPIPDNDVWIAALAMQHGLRLFTKDRHFDLIDELDLLQFAP